MDVRGILQAFFRWAHVVAGILWIGHLWFFNFVNAHFQAALDAETKKKVVPELMPRALFFFRWGAMWTWVTGFLLLGLVYYDGKLAWEGGVSKWGAASGLLVVATFLMFGAYDALAKALPRNDVLLVLGLAVVAAMAWAFGSLAGFGFRGTAIHVGAMFGTIMAANVWQRIWPNQKRIIAAVRAGQAPDPAWGAMASLRSRHNTYLSVPLVLTMLNEHFTWVSSVPGGLAALVLAGWGVTFLLYRKAAALTTA